MKFSKKNKNWSVGVSECRSVGKYSNTQILHYFIPQLLRRKLLLKSIYLTIFVCVFTGISACSYSFTGASVPSHLKTIAIPISVDRTGSGEASLSDDFTNELINKFLNDNTLQVAERNNSDALLECTILSLTDSPQVVAGGENIQTRRITLNAKVVYRDLIQKKNIFEKNFTNYGDYDSSADITAARADAITTAIDKITEDILLGVVSNW